MDRPEPRLSLLNVYDRADEEEVEVLDATDAYVDHLQAQLAEADRLLVDAAKSLKEAPTGLRSDLRDERRKIVAEINGFRLRTQQPTDVSANASARQAVTHLVDDTPPCNHEWVDSPADGTTAVSGRVCRKCNTQEVWTSGDGAIVTIARPEPDGVEGEETKE